MTAIPQIVSPTIEAIEAAVVASEPREFDRVIRCHSIGHACERYGWYKWRWAFPPEQFEGRMLRLFDTGHCEEARMVAWLKAAGVDVRDVDPDTGEQWEVEALDGHMKGHTDGEAVGILEAPKTPHLLECKTHNAKSFAQLLKHGVAIAKPEHVAQMQIYMHLKGLTRAFYVAKNKDDDSLHVERIHYDEAHALALMAKAERIKAAIAPPERVSDRPDYFLCQAFKCPAYDICHTPGWALRNCRTCLHSSPINDGQWYCQRHERELRYEDQEAGCPSHLYLPGLVHGEQVDADPKNETVTYRLLDGSEWVDGAGVGA